MKVESYKKRGETLYRFRVTLPADETGKRRKVQQSGFKSKLEAEKALVKVKESRPKIREIKTFDDAFQSFVDLKKFEVKESTIERMYSTYDNHFKDTLGRKRIDKISSQDLQNLIFQLYEKFQTPHKMILLVERVFKYAYKQRLIAENPCDFIVKPRIKPRQETDNFYTREELKEFLKCAERDLSFMWFVFFRLLAFSGMRRGEALALKRQDLDDRGIMICRTISRGHSGHIVSDTPKTDKSRRYILLDNLTINLLNKLDHNGEFIFSNSKGSFITPSQPVKKLHTVKGVRYISPHGFRHTHCSLLFSAGVSIPEVQQRLGHKDIKTTLNIYNHIYKEDAEQALQKFIDYMGQSMGQSVGQSTKKWVNF